MAAIQDAVSALIGIVGADAAVQTLLGVPPNDRIFGLELDRDEAGSQPRKSLVISLAGGPGPDDYVELTRIRIDTLCYGETPPEAYKLSRTVHPVLKQINRQVQSNVLIHSVLKSAGPISLRDRDTDWPLTLDSWLVIVSELATA